MEIRFTNRQCEYGKHDESRNQELYARDDARMHPDENVLQAQEEEHDEENNEAVATKL